MNKESNHNPRRILMVDNDPDFLSEWGTALKHAGYVVVTAGSRAEVETFFEGRWVHAMIVDVRLIDDDDARDKSGLTLAFDERYRTIPKIILTGFEDWRDSREITFKVDQRYARVVYVPKKEGLESLLEALAELFPDRPPAETPAILWQDSLTPPTLFGWLMPEAAPLNLAELSDELTILLRKLCQTGRQITIARLIAYRRGRVTLAVYSHTLQGARPMVVILGNPELLRAELQAFEKYAAQLNQVNYQNHVSSVHFAAACFELPGADLERLTTFQGYYYLAGEESVKATLDSLLNRSLAPWYQGGRSRRETSPELLARSFSQEEEPAGTLAFSSDQLRELANQLLDENLARFEIAPDELLCYLEPAGEARSLVNPFPYLDTALIKPSGSLLWGITYGLLNGAQVLTGGETDSWLLDFTHSGPGPLLRDFAGLETMIKTNYPGKYEAGWRFELERALVNVERLDEPLKLENLPGGVFKTGQAIQAVRLAAAAVLGPESHDYLVGLFYANIVQLATFRPAVRHTPAQLLAYLQHLFSAALLCKQLSPLPPQAVNGLWIDPQSQAVWVEGDLKEPGRQEKSVLLYLYEYHGRLCTRADILGKALGAAYAGADRGESNRLDTTISRLREQIEPLSSEPRYIETVRGEGYVLHLRPMPGQV